MKQIIPMRRFPLLAVMALLAFAACKSDVTTPTNTYKIRKNIKDLSTQEKQNYVDAVLKMKTTTSPYDPGLNYYDQFVAWHREAFACNNGAAHMGPAFLPWHRQFLLLFEKALNDVNPGKNITIPYWDWTDTTSTQAVFANDFMGGGGDSAHTYAVMTGPFQKGQWTLNITDPPEVAPIQYTWLTRGIGTYKKGGLPTVTQINYMLARPEYDVAPWSYRSDTDQSFRNFLEGWRGCYDTNDCTAGWMTPNRCKSDTIWSSKMHNVVHLWVGGVWHDSVGGTMTLNTSPNDPVFWIHHSNIDRMWVAWAKRHPNSYQPQTGGPNGHNYKDVMWPWTLYGLNITPEKMMSSDSLGYQYSVVP
ncbi:MAG TPA: tyrosinase family protein [Candidatus Kapabacteria bacterium]|nr:tyrosinase family protein [Candidatus Kapabacteria bacterium]